MPRDPTVFPQPPRNASRGPKPLETLGSAFPQPDDPKVAATTHASRLGREGVADAPSRGARGAGAVGNSNSNHLSTRETPWDRCGELRPVRAVVAVHRIPPASGDASMTDRPRSLTEALRGICPADDDGEPDYALREQDEPPYERAPQAPASVPRWMTVRIGQYRDKPEALTLPQIVFRNGDWFFHCYENGVFGREPFGATLHYSEAQLIYRRASAIRLKPGDVVEYVVDGDHLEGLRFRPAAITGGAVGPFHSVLDMRFPRKLKRYGKGNYKALARDIFDYFFGTGSHMTKRRMEEFFNDETRFKNP